MRDNDPPLSLTAHCNLTQVQKTSDRWGKHRRSSLQEGNKQGRAEAAEVSCTENRTAAPRSDNQSNSSPSFHRQQQQKQPNRPQQKRPVGQRYEGFQHKVHDETTYRRPKPFTPPTFTSEPHTPEPYKPKTFAPVRLDTNPVQRNFQQQFNEDTEFDFEEEMKKFDFENQRALQEPRKNLNYDSRTRFSKPDVSTLKVESRETTFEDVTSPDLKTIFDQNPLFADAEFQQSFEPERFSFAEIEKQSGENNRKFNPPEITEKFKSPLKESQSYPFLLSPGQEKTNFKQRKVKPFINYKTLVKKPKETKKRKTESQPNVQTFSNFERIQEIPKTAAPPPPAPVALGKQSSYEKLPTFTHFKSKPSSSSFKAKPTKVSSKPRKPSKPTTTYSPTLKTFDKLPTFTNFKTINSSPNTSLLNSKKPSEPTSKPFPSFISFKPESEQSKKPQPQTEARTAYKTYEVTTVKPTELPTTPQPTTTRKPYNYQKKNFREPLKQVEKNSGEHQIIRIKAKQESRARPQPKQLDIPQSGFQPIAAPGPRPRARPQPQPGRLEIQEVNRRQGVYQPSDVIFDNDQPLLTLESVKPFRARSNPDSFAVDVKASFNPKPKQENKRPQRLQKRLMRLPNSKFSHLLHRRPVKSNKVAVAQ